MTDTSTAKRSLILAGGGMRLAYHAGVLQAMEEAGMGFGHVDGTSGGIFGTAMLASGVTPTEAAARWRKLNLNGFTSILPLRNYRSQHSLPAIGSSEGVRKKIFPGLGIDVAKINAHRGFDATFNVCNFRTKSVESIHHTAVTEDHLVAGMSLPIFMPAVAIGGTWYTDAVWIKDANLTEAVRRGSQEVWLIWCIGNTPEYLHGFFNQYVHMIEMSADGALVNELDWINDQNKGRIKAGEKPVVVHLVKPEYPLPLDPDFFLHKINADTLINMGYADTKSYLASQQPLSLSGNGNATTMKDPGVTLHFRQQFEGSLKMADALVIKTIRLSFFVHETGVEYVWRQFSSIEMEDGTVHSGYNNSVSTGKGVIDALFVVCHAKQDYSIQVSMQLNSTIDLLLGLDIKSARVKMAGKHGTDEIAVFFQSALARIKNAFYLNINAEKSWWGKLVSKQRLLKTVFK